MKNKKCCKCKSLKSTDMFFKDSSRSDGYYHSCKECESKRNELRRRSKHGVVRTMHKGQVYTSLKRKHDPPKYTFKVTLR